jgi:hypothetical protein
LEVEGDAVMVELVGPDEPLWEVTLDEGVAYASVPETILGKALSSKSARGSGGGIVIISVVPSGDPSDWSSLTEEHPEVQTLEIDVEGAANEAIQRLVQAANETGHVTHFRGGSGNPGLSPH